MKLYTDKEQYKLYHGSMLDMLKIIEPNTIDSIVTDPPYELGFMGKFWDNTGIAFKQETWEKCFEVLKPGGYLLAFGGTRTYHRIACAIEDAGFEIRDTIMWLYGSGFPKSLDISKAIDKRGAVSIGWFADYLKQTLKEKSMTQSDLAKHFLSKTGGITGCVHNWIESKNMPTLEQFNKICKILELPFENIKECEREVIGTKKTNLTVYQNIGNENITGDVEITNASSDLAKQWNGWGTALKPAYEPIIVARKPFKTSVAENIMQYGVGGINIDECRIKTEDDLYRQPCENGSIYSQTDKKITTGTFNNNYKLGRFPSNVIHDGSEEVIKDMPDTKGDNRESKSTYDKGIWGNANPVESNALYSDSGSASRYFYCAKASKKDRDEGLDMFDSMQVNDGRSTPIDNAFQRGETQRKNIHPTVKPVELMQYLVRLVTPKNGIILDCFCGSGSTGKAAMFENRERNANYKFIGIELTEEYLPIAEARIDYALNKYEYDFKKELEEAKELGQQNIFDLLGVD